MIAMHYGKTLSITDLRSKCKRTKGGVTFQALSDAGEEVGFKTFGTQVSIETLKNEVPFPCIVQWKQRHLVVVNGVKKGKIIVTDPVFGTIFYDEDAFVKSWTGKNNVGAVLLLEPTPELFEYDEIQLSPKSGFNFLFRYFRQFRAYITQIFVGLIVGSLIQLVFPFLTQAVVDYGINNQDIGFVYLLLMAQLALFFSQTGIDVIRNWLLLHLGNKINISILSSYLKKLMSLPISFFDSKLPGDLYRRVEDNTRIEAFISSTSFNTIFSLINFFVFSVILTIYSFNIFLIFLFGSVLYVFWIISFLKKREAIDFIRFDESAGNSSSLIQLIYGMQEIKLNNSEKRRRWEWEGVRAKLYKIALLSNRLEQTQLIGGNFLNELKNIIISFYSASLVISGDITLGMMLAIQYIIGQLNAPLASFIPLLRQGQDAKLSLNRIAEAYEEKSESEIDAKKHHEIPTNEGLALKKLSFQYGTKSSEFILNEISINIPAGKTTAIVGASGSGKTTLLKLLLKIYQPQKGEILLGSTSFEDYSAVSWRNQCGVVMQDGFIFSDTVVKNITESDSTNEVDKERLKMASEISNSKEFIDELPGGFNARIGSSGIPLSGGQKQRILIARALYKNPSYVFFDEATSALDSNNEKEIIQNLNSFLQGKTVVIIAHRLSTVKNADQILVMQKGQIIESGDHRSLVEAKGAYFQLIKNQLELGE
jgi:ATP-binding cassette subfamily B protein